MSLKRVFGGSVRTADLVLPDKQPHQDYDVCMANFVAAVRDRLTAAYPTAKVEVIPDHASKNFSKIYVRNSNNHNTIGEAYAFVEKSTGYIYRAASLTAPYRSDTAPYKGARGSIFSPDNGASVCGPDGIAPVNRRA